MKKYTLFLTLVFFLTNCKNAIKNENAITVLEAGTESRAIEKVFENEPESKFSENNFIGFWVGYFLKDVDENNENEKDLYVDEGYVWTRENKINISIDKIEGEKVTGHSVVAGNNRPFSGTITNESGTFSFKVNEPGDNKYDGTFTFTIKDSLLTGTWKAFGKIDIPKRKYSLAKKVFKYNPDIQLENGDKRYIDWEKLPENSKVVIDEDISSKFASATNKIYTINASNKILAKEDVENLKKGDLLIIRNTIYARHGYSFKSRPLRVFFDAQEWYIPVYSDIKNYFTEIEKKNIELLLLYEKNAKEYYDYFGRG